MESLEYFDYDKMNLIPKKSFVNSRSECDTHVTFGPRAFKLPTVPANMECVMNEDIAIMLAQKNYFYIMHRFDIDIVTFAQRMIKENLFISISIGVNNDAYTIIDTLRIYNIYPEYITIDIAHGHCNKMKDIILYIKNNIPSAFIIAGNVSSPDGVRDLESWGADAIKVGIGPGSACTTYNATGFGSRGAQASIVELCSRSRKNPATKIVADGGIAYHGDIAKSLVLGAHMVMVGGLFSGLSDSPGNIVQGVDGRTYKEFWGSASSFQSNKKNRIEGTKKLVLMKPHTLLEEMTQIEESLQSAISYGGGINIECFKTVQYFIR